MKYKTKRLKGNGTTEGFVFSWLLRTRCLKYVCGAKVLVNIWKI